MREELSHRYLDRAAERYPQKTAVTDGRTAVTFGSLAAQTDQLGRLLVALGISRGDRVAYSLPRGIDCINATLGILKCGAAYVPLDEKTPPARWQRIVCDAAPRALVCNSATLMETAKRLLELDTHPYLISLSPRMEPADFYAPLFFREQIEAATGALPADGCLDDVAYVLYTSGSTGAPKGVMITHGNIRNYIDWATDYFSVSAGDRILSTAPFYFDMSTFDIFCFLASGATLCVATNEALLFPEKLVRFMEREEVTLWKGVASLLMYMCRAGVLRAGRMPALRTVIFAGEPLGAQYLAKWMEIFPEKSYFNGYGPTEATGVSFCYHVDGVPEPGEPIPIGQPCKGARVVSVGEDGLPVGSYEIGELCIAGPCLAKGYLNDLEKTESSFTPPPPGCEDLGDRVYHTGDLVRQTGHGDWVFVSRKDHQVKWMGYRIELAEIETSLMAHPQIRDAVVLLPGAPGDSPSELLAFFEAEGALEPATIARFLADRLPHYMVPKRFIRVASIPRNDRAKVARDELLEQYLRSLSHNHASLP